MATAANFDLKKDSAFLKAGIRAKITIKGLVTAAVMFLLCCCVIAYTICLNTLADRAEYTMLNGSMPKTMTLAAKVVEDNLSGAKTPEAAAAALSEVEMTENAKLTIIDNTGKVIAGEAIDAPAETIAKLNASAAGNANYDHDGVKSIMSYAPISGTSWSIVMTAPRTDFGSMRRAGVIYCICLAAFVLLLALFGLTAALPKLTTPLKILVPAIERTAAGDFAGEVPDAGPTYVDFIRLQDSVGVLMSKTNAVIADISYVLGEMAQGNFIVQSRSPESYVGDYKSILEAEELIRYQLSNTLTEINDVSEQVSSGSEQVSNGAQTLAQGATEQASSVEELSATTADVAIQIKDSAEFAEQARVLTTESGEIMNGTMQAMGEAKAAMDEISETSNNISKVIKAIDDIAFQTNILALNAAVEAARAGAAGKGFAVVADEVRNLSQKSAEAAKNTTVLIESSIEAVNKGNKLVDKATSDFSVVVEKSSKINEIVNTISEQFRQQAIAANQISQGIEQVASVIQMNSATSEESAAASQELSGQANILKDLVSQFKLDESIQAF